MTFRTPHYIFYFLIHYAILHIFCAQENASSINHDISPDAIISYYEYEFEQVPFRPYIHNIKGIKFFRLSGYFLTNIQTDVNGKVYHLVDVNGNDDICDEIPAIPYLIPNATWIALISQSQKCSISHQIETIAKAKASAIIIYRKSNNLDWFISAKEYVGEKGSPSHTGTMNNGDDPGAYAGHTNLAVVYLGGDRAKYFTRYVDTLSARYNMTPTVNLTRGWGKGTVVTSPPRLLLPYSLVGSDDVIAVPPYTNYTSTDDDDEVGGAGLVPPTHRNNRIRVGLAGGGAANTRPYSTNGFSRNQQTTFVSRTSIMFVSISFIVLMIISLAWLVFYYVQRFRYAHAKDQLAKRLNSAAKKALVKIPLRTVKVDDKVTAPDSDACAVCIESFRPNEIIRELKCGHTFHKMCVDTWLLLQRSCPICKLDILEAYGLTIDKSRRTLKPCNGGGGAGHRSHHDHHLGHGGGAPNVAALFFGSSNPHPLTSGGGRRGRRPLSFSTGGAPLQQRQSQHRPASSYYDPEVGYNPSGTDSFVMTGDARLFTEFSDSTSDIDRIMMGGGFSGATAFPNLNYVIHPTSPMPLPIPSYEANEGVAPSPQPIDRRDKSCGPSLTTPTSPPTTSINVSKSPRHTKRSKCKVTHDSSQNVADSNLYGPSIVNSTNHQQHYDESSNEKKRSRGHKNHHNHHLKARNSQQAWPTSPCPRGDIMLLSHLHPGIRGLPAFTLNPASNYAHSASRCSSTPSLSYASATSNAVAATFAPTSITTTPTSRDYDDDARYNGGDLNSTGSSSSSSYSRGRRHVLVLPPFLTSSPAVTLPSSTRSPSPL